MARGDAQRDPAKDSHVIPHRKTTRHHVSLRLRATGRSERSLSIAAGFSQQVAELFAEMYSAFATGKIQPHGARLVQGKTPLEATIATLVG